MRTTITVLALVALCLSEDVVDHKKRGVQKGSTHNIITNNSRQKPETPTSHVQQTIQHSVVSQQEPIQQPPEDTQPPQEVVNPQQVYTVPQQIIPIHVIHSPQQLLAPRFQILASRNPNGQMQLTLIPHSVLMNLVYGNSLIPSPVQPIVTNHIQQSTNQITPTAPSTVETVYSNYVTPQPVVYSPTSPVPVASNNYYANQPYTYASASQSQPVVYSQPIPSYHHHNFITPSVSNSVYSPNSYYYQSPSPQSKYQVLYGANNQQYEQQSQNYQTIPNSEYEKSNLIQSHQIHKNDVSSHTNEYLSPPDTHFKPIHAYPRGPVSYKS